MYVPYEHVCENACITCNLQFATPEQLSTHLVTEHSKGDKENVDG